MRKIFLSAGLVAVVAAVTMPFSAVATPGQWAGSGYDRSECELTKGSGKPLLTCGKWVVSVAPATQSVLLEDEACQTGVRWIERTGTLESKTFQFDLYAGHVPLPKFRIGGDEGGSVHERWLEMEEKVLDCT